ncbi:MAG TPA: hypothetical protein VF821_32915, partial [Lentzea sp.]
VVVVDVDGVLAVAPGAMPEDRAVVRELGYQAHEFDGSGPDGSPARGMVWLKPEHGVWLRELADQGAELVWGTSWGHVAVTWIAPRLGLPELRVIEVPNQAPAFGWSPKIGPIQRWVGDRPLAWIDDQLGGKEPGWAEERRDDGIPTLIVQPYPWRGLERTHVEQILAWLAHSVPSAGIPRH